MGGQKDNFVFLGVLPHMIHFWNPWDQRSTQEVFQEVFDTIMMIRKVENDKKWDLDVNKYLDRHCFHCSP